MDTTSETIPCGYCGEGTTEPTGLHADLYGLLNEFYHEHRDNPSWQHAHEYAARIEALFRTPANVRDGERQARREEHERRLAVTP